MAAFTQQEATCSAINMCCYLTYYMTCMDALFLHALRPANNTFLFTVDLNRMWLFSRSNASLLLQLSQATHAFYAAFTCHFVVYYFTSATSLE